MRARRARQARQGKALFCLIFCTPPPPPTKKKKKSEKVELVLQAMLLLWLFLNRLLNDRLSDMLAVNNAKFCFSAVQFSS